MKNDSFRAPSRPEPTCQEHGRLVLDLAQGRLDLPRAAVAEQIRQDCPACRSWWQDALAGEQATTVDAAVAEAFADFEAPRRSHPRRWLAAAAVFFALVLGLSLLERQGGRGASPGGELRVAADKILEEGFESNGRLLTVVVEPTDSEAQASRDRIFVSGFEAGDFSTWSPERL